MLGLFASILNPSPAATAASGANRHAAYYVGQEFTLMSPIVGGRGRLIMGAGTWLIGGPDLPAGARVRVTAVEGPRMRVVKA